MEGEVLHLRINIIYEFFNKILNNIMTELYQINVKLSEGQKRKLAKAYRDNEEVSVTLAHNHLSGSDTLMVPKNTVNRVAKSLELGKGVQIKITKANVRKQTGSGIFTSLLPVLRNVAPSIGKTVGLSALAGFIGFNVFNPTCGGTNS